MDDPKDDAERINAAVACLNPWLKRSAGGMSLIIPGLYVGSLRDALDIEQLSDKKVVVYNFVISDTSLQITDIISVHDFSRTHPQHQNLRVLHVRISDRPESNLIEYIAAVNSFIHSTRLEKRSFII